MKADTRYKVKITGLKTKGGTPAQIQYMVHFVDIRKAPDSPDGRRIYYNVNSGPWTQLYVAESFSR